MSIKYYNRTWPFKTAEESYKDFFENYKFEKGDDLNPFYLLHQTLGKQPNKRVEKVTSNAEQATIVLEVPGFSKERVLIEAKEKTLVVTLLPESKEAKSECLFYELRDSADLTKISAVCKDGLLTIVVPVKPKPAPEMITIHVG